MTEIKGTPSSSKAAAPGTGTDGITGELGEALYRLVLDHLTHEVHIWKLIRDGSGKIETWNLAYANPSALAAWGQALPDIVGRSANEIFSTDATSTFMPVVEKIFADQKPMIWEEHFDGTGQVLQMVSIPMGEYFISTGLDITSQRNAERELHQSQKLAAIGQLAGGIAHDFNNQLTGILGYAELLEGKLQRDELQEYVGAIRNTAKRSANLTAQLLAFARQGKADFETLDVNRLLKESIGLLSHSVDRKIEIRTDFTQAKTRVSGDAGLLENVFLNIALNARDAMPDGGVLNFSSELIEIGPSSDNPSQLPYGDYVCVSITDTGAGMDAEIVDHVFDPFFTTKDDGHGMGMASAYGSVQRHGGTIIASSRPGAGATFRVLLPVENPSANASARTTPAKASARVAKVDELPAASLRVLVVDDEPALCTLFEKVLGLAGHAVTSFTSSQLALDHFEANYGDYDLVLLDINMPQMNGIDLLREMKAHDPDIKALVTSGYSVEESRAEVLAAGFIGFVQKPFDSQHLRDAVAAAGATTAA